MKISINSVNDYTEALFEIKISIKKNLHCAILIRSFSKVSFVCVWI